MQCQSCTVPYALHLFGSTASLWLVSHVIFHFIMHDRMACHFIIMPYGVKNKSFIASIMLSQIMGEQCGLVVVLSACFG